MIEKEGSKQFILLIKINKTFTKYKNLNCLIYSCFVDLIFYRRNFLNTNSQNILKNLTAILLDNHALYLFLFTIDFFI